MVLVLLDISLILTAAISDIPNMYLQQNEEFKSKIEEIAKNNLQKNCKIIIDLSDKNKIIDYPESCKSAVDNNESILDKILPSPTTLEGPLLYM